MSDYLFLYGTLKSGETKSDVADTVKRLRRVGPASIKGKLYDFGDYPGAVIDEASKTLIKGELFELPDDNSVLKSLDQYEEFDQNDRRHSLFVRVRTTVNVNNARRLRAWVYVYNRDPSRGRVIASGDYSSKAA